MKRISLISLLLLCCGCSPEEEELEARFRTINASPDVGAIDVFIDESVLFNAVPYTSATDYQTLDAVPQQFRVTKDNSFTTFLDSTERLAADSSNTLILFDFAEDAEAALIVDDDQPSTEGRAKVRIIHAAPSLEDVDVYINRPAESVASVVATLESVRFKEDTDYLESAAGPYRIQVTESATPNVVAESATIPLEAEKIYTILLLDAPGGGSPFRVSVLQDS